MLNIKSVIKLTAEGEAYAKNGLPERNLIRAVEHLADQQTCKWQLNKLGLEPQFVQIALGWAIRKKWALTPQATTHYALASR